MGLVLTAGGLQLCRILGSELGEPGSSCGGAADVFLGFLGFRSQLESAGRSQPCRAEHSLRADLVDPARHTGMDREGRAQGKECPGCASLSPRTAAFWGNSATVSGAASLRSRSIRSPASARQATQTPVTLPASCWRGSSPQWLRAVLLRITLFRCTA
jgi:hypothetical protein